MWAGVLDIILRIQRLDRADIEALAQQYRSLVEQLEAGSQGLHVDSEQAVAALRTYLIAAAAKDCSVMLTFRRTAVGALAGPDQSVIEDADKTQYLWKVAVMDMDVKSVAKIPLHHAADREMVRVYEAAMAS